MNTIFEVFLTRAEPGSIGLSSVGARLMPLSLSDEGGLYYRIGRDGETLGENSTSVLAPIAPGIISRVPIDDWRTVGMGERVSVESRNCTVALDGERSFSVNAGQFIDIEVQRDGPPVVQVDVALELAARRGVFNLAPDS